MSESFVLGFARRQLPQDAQVGFVIAFRGEFSSGFSLSPPPSSCCRVARVLRRIFRCRHIDDARGGLVCRDGSIRCGRRCGLRARGMCWGGRHGLCEHTIARSQRMFAPGMPRKAQRGDNQHRRGDTDHN